MIVITKKDMYNRITTLVTESHTLHLAFKHDMFQNIVFEALLCAKFYSVLSAIGPSAPTEFIPKLLIMGRLVYVVSCDKIVLFAFGFRS